MKDRSGTEMGLVLVNPLSEIESAYVACAVDTEGSILEFWSKSPESIGGKRLIVRVVIYNTNLEFLQNIMRIVGTGQINKGPTGVGFRKSGCYSFKVGRRPDVKSLVEQITPYLVIKRQKGENLIQILNDKLYGHRSI